MLHYKFWEKINDSSFNKENLLSFQIIVIKMQDCRYYIEWQDIDGYNLNN